MKNKIQNTTLSVVRTAKGKGPFRCISRVLGNAAQQPHWQVRIMRDGVSRSKCFSDHKYPSPAHAMAEAMLHRDFLEKCCYRKFVNA